MAAAADQIAYPEWTEYRTSNGLDPLGMQISSIGLYQALLPGISNITLRVRYYGLYTWLCRIYAREIGDTNPETWRQIVRRSEALYALIAIEHGNETGVAGTQWAARALAASSNGTIDFSSAANVQGPDLYLQQSWGVFGAAYRSQLYNVGLFGDVAEHQIPVTGPDFGDAVADAFEDALGGLAHQFFTIAERGNVSKKELEKLLLLSPSEIASDSEERNWYERILFGHAGLERETEQARRRTLSLVLQVARQLRRVPTVEDIRWILYAGSDESGTRLSPGTDDLAHHRLRWWLYHANDLLHVAYETLLRFSLDVLSQHPAGITLAALIDEVVSTIKAASQDWPASWDNLRAQNENDDPYTEKAATDLIMGATRANRFCTPEAAWEAIRLLAIVESRCADHEAIVQQDLGSLNPSVFKSLNTELKFLREIGEGELSKALRALIEQRIVRRHLWVALRKLRVQGDYTFLIEADDGRVRMRAQDGPVFTNPRLSPAGTFLQDIHLIDDEGITSLGRKVLAAG